MSESTRQQLNRKETNRRTANVFLRKVKSAATRLREVELQAQIERARVRVDLLNREKRQLEQENSDIVKRRKALAAQVC